MKIWGVRCLEKIVEGLKKSESLRRSLKTLALSAWPVKTDYRREVRIKFRKPEVTSIPDSRQVS